MEYQEIHLLKEFHLFSLLQKHRCLGVILLSGPLTSTGSGNPEPNLLQKVLSSQRWVEER